MAEKRGKRKGKLLVKIGGEEIKRRRPLDEGPMDVEEADQVSTLCILQPEMRVHLATFVRGEWSTLALVSRIWRNAVRICRRAQSPMDWWQRRGFTHGTKFGKHRKFDTCLTFPNVALMAWSEGYFKTHPGTYRYKLYDVPAFRTRVAPEMLRTLCLDIKLLRVKHARASFKSNRGMRAMLASIRDAEEGPDTIEDILDSFYDQTGSLFDEREEEQYVGPTCPAITKLLDPLTSLETLCIYVNDESLERNIVDCTRMKQSKPGILHLFLQNVILVVKDNAFPFPALQTLHMKNARMCYEMTLDFFTALDAGCLYTRHPNGRVNSDILPFPTSLRRLHIESYEHKYDLVPPDRVLPELARPLPQLSHLTLNLSNSMALDKGNWNILPDLRGLNPAVLTHVSIDGYEHGTSFHKALGDQLNPRRPMTIVVSASIANLRIASDDPSSLYASDPLALKIRLVNDMDVKPQVPPLSLATFGPQLTCLTLDRYPVCQLPPLPRLRKLKVKMTFNGKQLPINLKHLLGPQPSIDFPCLTRLILPDYRALCTRRERAGEQASFWPDAVAFPNTLLSLKLCVPPGLRLSQLEPFMPPHLLVLEADCEKPKQYDLVDHRFANRKGIAVIVQL